MKLGVAWASWPRVDGLDWECIAATCLYLRGYTAVFLPPSGADPFETSLLVAAAGSFRRVEGAADVDVSTPVLVAESMLDGTINASLNWLVRAAKKRIAANFNS